MRGTQAKPRSLCSLRRVLWPLVFVAAAFSLNACKSNASSPESSWSELRKRGSKSDKDDQVAEWLVAELLRPGGTPEQAIKARARLDAIKADGVLADLARGLDSLAHGQSKRATEEFFSALVEAQTWDDPRASLYAWFAATRVEQLSSLVQDFERRHRSEITNLLENPGHIGFRAYASVVELWANDAFKEANKDVDTKLAKRLGCL